METVSSRVEDGREGPEIGLNNGFKVAMINMFKKLKEAIFQKLKENIRNFSSGPMGKTSHFHCRGAGFNPCSGN